jgi:hypothetical protein
MKPSPEITLLLQLLDQAYDHKSWHGPNLKGSLRRVTASEAAWRPGSSRHSIAEIEVHCDYWKYAAHRRLTGGKRGSFALKGSNWFALPDPLDEATWRGYLKLLDECHAMLRATVADLPASQLAVVPPGSRVTNLALIQGMAAHDVYHAGQVQLLKRLQS